MPEAIQENLTYMALPQDSSPNLGSIHHLGQPYRSLHSNHVAKKLIADFWEKPDESSKHSNEFGCRIGSCKAGNIKAFAGACPASEQPQAPRLACKQPPTGPPATRHHLKFLLTLWEAACRRSFPSKRSAAAPVRKRSFELFPEIRDEPKKSPLSRAPLSISPSGRMETLHRRSAAKCASPDSYSQIHCRTKHTVRNADHSQSSLPHR